MNKTTQNRKIIPHQCMFLCLAMSICCGIVGCKCRKDSKTYHPGKPASSIPHAINQTKSYAVKELKGANGERSFFNYSNGKMTEGYGTAYGHFIISEYPLRIMVSSANDTLPGCSSNETLYFRFYVTKEGYVTAMNFAGHQMQQDGISKTISYSGQITATYDHEGHVASIQYQYEDDQGDGECGHIRYIWHESKLTNMTTDISQKKTFHERHDILTFHYDNSPARTATAPRHVFLKEMNACPFIYDFMWFAGLFGQPPKEIPYSLTCESMGDKKKEDAKICMIANYDTPHKVLTVRYGNGCSIAYHYDKTTELKKTDNPLPMTYKEKTGYSIP